MISKLNGIDLHTLQIMQAIQKQDSMSQQELDGSVLLHLKGTNLDQYYIRHLNGCRTVR